MADKVRSGEAKDVSPFRQPVGTYLLPPGFYEDDVDYCDVELEVWIWSVGKEKTSAGRIFAAVDGRFYLNPAYDCLWLR